MRIDASGLSDQDGDRLRELLQLFVWREVEAKELYQQAQDDGLAPSVLVSRRSRWKAWRAARHEFAVAFDRSSVPSTVPPEALRLLAAERRRTATELMAQVRERTRGATGVDDEIRRLRGSGP